MAGSQGVVGCEQECIPTVVFGVFDGGGGGGVGGGGAFVNSDARMCDRGRVKFWKTLLAKETGRKRYL